MILLGDPVVAALPTRPVDEPLVDLRTLGLRLDTRAADLHHAYAFVREQVALRLLAAQRALPGGLRLLVVEGYRPPAVQQAIFAGYRDELRRRYPEWTAARLRRETSRFVAPPEVAPHVTGGAVDLTLCDAGGVELDLGTPVDATPVSCANACFTAARNVPAAAREHRGVLVAALSGAGLVNYPTEWWHWSYGDRYWGLASGAGHARYAPAEGPGRRR